jgi:hypothetical protein
MHKRGPGERRTRRAEIGRKNQLECLESGFYTRYVVLHCDRRCGGSLLNTIYSGSISPSSQDAPTQDTQVLKECACFASLPGEIRNMIHSLVLIAGFPIKRRKVPCEENSICHDEKCFVTTRRFPCSTAKLSFQKFCLGPAFRHPARSPHSSSSTWRQSRLERFLVTTLAGYCTSSVSLNKKFVKEARSFFYSKNDFEFLVDDISGRLFTDTYRDAIYLKACTLDFFSR